MAIDYRQSGIDYRDEDYSYQGVQTHAIAAALTSTSSITSAVFKQAFVVAEVASTSAITPAVVVGQFPAYPSLPISSTSSLTAAAFKQAFIEIASGAPMASTSAITVEVFRRVPQPELTLSVSNILASSKAEEQQDTLTLLVGV